MRVKTGLAIGMLAALFGAASCYPKTCVPSDPTCWGCDVPGTQNPACYPFPSDVKKPDGGSR